jgi:hypothetical protein
MAAKKKAAKKPRRFYRYRRSRLDPQDARRYFWEEIFMRRLETNNAKTAARIADEALVEREARFPF